jgi:hypothetical protein
MGSPEDNEPQRDGVPRREPEARGISVIGMSTEFASWQHYGRVVDPPDCQAGLPEEARSDTQRVGLASLLSLSASCP